MHHHTQPFYLPIIPIIFKSNENLDNNYKKTIKNSPFIGYEEMSGVLNCGSFIDLPGATELLNGTLTRPLNGTLPRPRT
jgi:hypothetical protein